MVDEVEVTAEVAEITQAPPADAPAPTADADKAASPEAPTPEAKPREERKFGQEEVNRMMQKRLAKEARRLEREITEKVRSELAQKAPEAPPIQPQATGAPELKDFADYESWVRASARYEAAQELKATQERLIKESQQAREAASVSERQAYFRERVIDKGSEMFEDFEDVVLNERLPITDAMAITIAESDAGPVVAYYLGEHPEEAARISKLSPPSQVRELDKIAATLTKPAAPTKAPEPIKPNAATGSVEARLETASYDDFVKIRRKQIAARR